MSAAVIWVDVVGRMRAEVHPYEEMATEHAEMLAEQGLATRVVADYELEAGEGGEDGG